MNEPDDMDLKRKLDALPRAIEPPADLWPGVRKQLRSRRPRSQTVEDLIHRPRHVIFHSPNIRIAALLTLLAVSAGALAISRKNAATWHVADAGGPSRVITAGDSLSTGATGTATLTVGSIGHLEVAAATDIRVLKASLSEQRLSLVRGKITAEISAPPRLFIVETPSGTAVDLGCAYTLEVDSAGTSTIAVTAGWVSFEGGTARSLIPAGMHATTRKGMTLGTPLMNDASAELRGAVKAFDETHADSSLGVILRTARTRDAVTLWHLVTRTDGANRDRVVRKLVAMVPLPDGVPEGDISRAWPHAMDLYWTRLAGTLPIIPSWQQTLWKIWLKVAG